MATQQDSNDLNYSDIEKLERAVGSRLILPAWIIDLDRAAVDPISTAPNIVSVGSPGSLSTGGAGADVSDVRFGTPKAPPPQLGTSCKYRRPATLRRSGAT